jgi:hypothetical protein
MAQLVAGKKGSCKGESCDTFFALDIEAQLGVGWVLLSVPPQVPRASGRILRFVE